MMLFGQTRIFFSMARDKLLPFNEALTRIHPKFHTPHVVTIVTGLAVTVFAAFFPVGVLADLSNSGTLFAFLTVAAGVMILRKREPDRHRPFRAPGVWIVGTAGDGGLRVLDVLVAAAHAADVLRVGRYRPAGVRACTATARARWARTATVAPSSRTPAPARPESATRRRQVRLKVIRSSRRGRNDVSRREASGFRAAPQG